MIKLFGSLPQDELWIGCSGGPDSMCAVDFCRQIPRRKVNLAFFHHGTDNSEQALTFLQAYAKSQDLLLTVGRLTGERAPRESPEEFWRNKRYEFLHAIPGPVVLGHHLDDQVEQYIFSALNGKIRYIPFRNKNCIRPFLTTPKTVLVDWCVRKEVPYVTDSSNFDLKYMRNRIRHNIVPEALRVNPGLRKVVARLIQQNVSAETGQQASMK